MNRRELLAITATAACGISPSLRGTVIPKRRKLGLTIWSYNIRWKQRKPNAPKPGWRNALDVLDHCHDLGAGCLQIGVNNWSNDFAKQVRTKRESLGIALEGQIGLPRKDQDLPRFENEIGAAREAGATVLRTVCLSGRRYEKFETMEKWNHFKSDSKAALERAEPIAAKHRVKLAVENHKDWRSDEQLELLGQLSSEWIGVTLDFGNNFSLLEHPHDVAEALAPYVMSTHIKDMAMAEYEKGFLLSEVPLGRGLLDLNHMMTLCEKANPNIWFNLEMITRDPLQVPVFEDGYYTTLPQIPAVELAKTLHLARSGSPDKLPTISGLSDSDTIEFEENNVRSSFEFARKNLGVA